MARCRSQSGQRRHFNRYNASARQHVRSLEVAESTPFAQLEQFILKSFRQEPQTGLDASSALPQPTSFVLGPAEDPLPEPSEDFTRRSPAPGPAQTSLARPSTPPEGSFTLAVEDDMPTEHLERYLLESAGHRVRTATSGEEALEVLEQASPSWFSWTLGCPEWTA
jgi:hypothetical protein